MTTGLSSFVSLFLISLFSAENHAVSSRYREVRLRLFVICYKDGQSRPVAQQNKRDIHAGQGRKG